MQQGGAPTYGAPPPEPPPFSGLGIPGSDHPRTAEPASPISSRPPSNFDDPAPSAAHGNFPDEDLGDRAAATGNRWPQQETLALLQIRSDMDPAFRDATLKGPLWEEVSRKLAGLGYRRSAKKCKEKFENVHKYYKRTKEGRVGRQASKSYRFFDQLEALHGAAAATAAAAIGPNTTSASVSAPVLAVTTPITTTTSLAPDPLPAPIATAGAVGATGPGTTPPAAPPTITPPAGISFSSNTSSSSASESEEDTEGGEGRKRKRKRKGKRGGGGEASREMMAFFEQLMRQVMERQEVMQQRFLEAIEKREQDRMVREEAWRRQEMTRLAREHELLAQERAAAASRDAAVVAFLQKLTGQNIHLPPPLATPVQTPPPVPPSQQPQLQLQPPQNPPQPQQPEQQQQQQPPQPQQPQQQQPPQPQQPQQQPLQQQSSTDIIRHHQPPSSSELVPVPEPQETVGGASLEPASSRWPKVEVHALIKLRSSLEARYQEAGPKGPLWEEISAEMGRLGYNRSNKRCKEKWENINKYFKKVKESNRKRPEDAKTCPYFHQLDALYRQKLNTGSGSGSGHMVTQRQQSQETNPTIPNPQGSGGAGALTIAAPPPQVHLPGTDSKNGNNSNRNSGNAEGSGGPSNGGHRPSFFEEGASSSGATMKPEDIVRVAMDDYDKLEDLESDDIEEHDGDNDDDDDEDEDEEGKMQYRVQFQQRQNASRGAAPATGSFLAMV